MPNYFEKDEVELSQPPFLWEVGVEITRKEIVQVRNQSQPPFLWEVGVEMKIDYNNITGPKSQPPFLWEVGVEMIKKIEHVEQLIGSQPPFLWEVGVEQDTNKGLGIRSLCVSTTLPLGGGCGVKEERDNIKVAQQVSTTLPLGGGCGDKQCFQSTSLLMRSLNHPSSGRWVWRQSVCQIRCKHKAVSTTLPLGGGCGDDTILAKNRDERVSTTLPLGGGCGERVSGTRIFTALPPAFCVTS